MKGGKGAVRLPKILVLTVVWRARCIAVASFAADHTQVSSTLAQSACVVCARHMCLYARGAPGFTSQAWQRKMHRFWVNARPLFLLR